MSKEELEEKIKNGEPVYIVDFDYICGTKEEAQHYIDNSNITRTERLPFITWEEFKKNPYFNFIDKKSRLIEVRLNLNKDRIYITNPDYVMTDFDYTEDGFYEAYKICRKLFLGR